MEEKITNALTEQALSISTTLAEAKNETSAILTHKTFAQATAQPGSKGVAKHPQPPKPKHSTAPPLFPYIVLSQRYKDKHVEMETDDAYLVERINRKLQFTADLYSTEEKPLKISDIRGFSRNRRSGDITIQFNSQGDVETATNLHDYWVRLLDPSLRLKMPSYAIIVHGIPTSFNPESDRDVDNLKAVNLGVLDSLDSIRWANRHSIESGKPFSSLLIHLRDPDEANKAIKYRLNFFSVLKVVEKLTRKLGQCFKCLGYGHSTARCGADPHCPSCDGTHPTGTTCPTSSNPTCFNCIKEMIATGKESNPAFDKTNLSQQQLARAAHTATAATCPLRRKLASKLPSREFFTVTKKNATTHDAR